MKQNLYQNTHNPLLPTEHHIPDVEAHVMSDGKLYLYGSYDDCKNAYCSNAYRVASTADMKSWTVSDRVFEGGCVPWFDETADVEKTHTEPTPFIRRMQREMELHPELDYFGTTMEKEQQALLYAPDCLEKDGTWYLYFCMEDGSEGVAVSERPDGPFRDPVRLPCSGIDPAVFLDEDGSAYYYWGQFAASGVQLNADCRSFDRSRVVQRILTEEEHGFHEGCSMRRIGDTYYAVFADISHGKPSSLGYATARTPLGPFTYRGIIIDNDGCDPSDWNNHGSIECFRGQWYVFYHRSSRNSKINRRVCAEKIEILPDGRIPEVKMTSQGPGEPFRPGELIYGCQACVCRGGCYIDYDAKRKEEYVRITADGQSAVFRYVSLQPGKMRMRAVCTGSMQVGIFLNGQCAGSGILTEGVSEIPVQVCENMAELPLEAELVFHGATEGGLLKFNFIFE